METAADEQAGNIKYQESQPSRVMCHALHLIVLPVFVVEIDEAFSLENSCRKASAASLSSPIIFLRSGKSVLV